MTQPESPSCYKIRNNIKYIATFPDEWIRDNNTETGPKNCLHCASYGTYKGIFLGYCGNCAKFEYNDYSHGNGFVNIGQEFYLKKIF